jgi:hypothetical protein
MSFWDTVVIVFKNRNQYSTDGDAGLHGSSDVSAWQSPLLKSTGEQSRGRSFPEPAVPREQQIRVCI